MQLKEPRNKFIDLLLWRVYFLLAGIQGGLVLLGLFRIQSETEKSFILGISRSRLAIAGGVIAVVLFFGWLLVRSWIFPDRTARTMQRLSATLQPASHSGKVVLLAGLGLLAGSYFVTLTPEISEPYTRAYFDRLLPIAIWITGLSVQTLIALPFARFGFDPQKFRPKSKGFFFLLAIFGILLFAWGRVAQTNLEAESQLTGWNSQGIPIIETQVILAWVAGLALLGILALKQGDTGKPGWLLRLKPRTLDVSIGILLWLSAVLLWSMIPVAPNWFASAPRPPNFENYPNSDAASYDFSSQTLLVGEGLQFAGTPFVRRPMYTLFLTALHAIAGQNYDTVVLLQILVLATLPVFLYFMTQLLHNRFSALIAAVLILLKEANAIALADTITSSNAKLLMADLPATLGIVCFACIAIYWLQKMERRRIFALACGGLLGVTVLIRPEFGFLVFALGLAALLVSRLRLKQWLQGMSLFVLGLGLILSPWIWRNWSLTGLIFLDSPSFRFEMLSERYKDIENPGEVPAPTSAPVEEPENVAPLTGTPAVVPPAPTQPLEAPAPITPSAVPTESLPYLGYVTSTAGRIAGFIRQNSAQVASFVGAHFLNSQMQMFLVLPTTFRPLDSLVGFSGHRLADKLWFECCSLQNYIRRLPYWHKWDGVFPSQAAVPLACNLVLIAVGILQAWKKNGFAGLTPIFLSTTHLLLNAIFRNSGGRYILPVDWVGVLYFSIGLAEVSLWGVNLFTRQTITAEVQGLSPAPDVGLSQQRSLLKNPVFYFLIAAIFLSGCILPFLERVIPPRYTQAGKAEMLAHV